MARTKLRNERRIPFSSWGTKRTVAATFESGRVPDLAWCMIHCRNGGLISSTAAITAGASGWTAGEP